MAALYQDISFPTLPDRPYVIVNMVATVDGKAVPVDDEHPLFGGKHDRPVMLQLRSQADALLYGTTTGKDVPPEEFLDSNFQKQRTAQGRAPLMKFVLLARSAKHLAKDNKIFSNPKFTPTLYVPEGTETDLSNVEVRRVGSNAVDLPAALKELKEKDGVDVALLEGGPTTNGTFFQAGLVDEFFLTVSPQIYGKSTLTVVESELLPAELGKLELISAESQDNEVFLRYKIAR